MKLLPYGVYLLNPISFRYLPKHTRTHTHMICDFPNKHTSDRYCHLRSYWSQNVCVPKCVCVCVLLLAMTACPPPPPPPTVLLRQTCVQATGSVSVFSWVISSCPANAPSLSREMACFHSSLSNHTAPPAQGRPLTHTHAHNISTCAGQTQIFWPMGWCDTSTSLIPPPISSLPSRAGPMEQK